MTYTGHGLSFPQWQTRLHLPASRRVPSWVWEIMWTNWLSDIHIQIGKQELSQVTEQVAGKAEPQWQLKNEDLVGASLQRPPVSVVALDEEECPLTVCPMTAS